MIVRVLYHAEPEGIWTESPDVEGLAVAGASLAEVRGLVREGLEFYLERDDIDLREEFEKGNPLVS
jgi:predicted RNase H-like HicB family nuclease